MRIKLAVLLLCLSALTACGCSHDYTNEGRKTEGAQNLPNEAIRGGNIDIGKWSQTFHRELKQLSGIGKIVHHNFILVNKSNYDIPINGAMAGKPCCSTIKISQKCIPAHGELQVPVTLKPGPDTGTIEVPFWVFSDVFPDGKIELTLQAECLASKELISKTSDMIVLDPGQSFIVGYKLVCRNNSANEGFDFPDSINVSPALKVEIVNKRMGREDGRNFKTGECEILVSLPANNDSGNYSGSIILNWESGAKEESRVSWIVRPYISVYPEGINFVGDSKQRFVMKSSYPFKIEKVEGVMLEEFKFNNGVDKLINSLDIRTKKRLSSSNFIEYILIETNLPQQKIVRIPVVNASGGGN